MSNRGIIFIGGGGHATVLAEILEAEENHIIGICTSGGENDNQTSVKYPVLGNDSAMDKYHPSEIILVNAIGSVNLPDNRMNVFISMKQKNLEFLSIVHKKAIVSKSIVMQEGCQIMAGAIVQTNVSLGKNVLLNTGSIIDHDCMIGDHTHIAPGAKLSGNVKIGECVHIGTGATVIQGVQIGKSVVIGAGVTVLKDIPDNTFIKASGHSVWK